jgi:hypothetical protein
MATKLKTNVTRETDSDDGNGRSIIVTLNCLDQTIQFKPKGRTSKAIVSLPISKIYQLVKNAQ